MLANAVADAMPRDMTSSRSLICPKLTASKVDEPFAMPVTVTGAAPAPANVARPLVSARLVVPPVTVAPPLFSATLALVPEARVTPVLVTATVLPAVPAVEPIVVGPANVAAPVTPNVPPMVALPELLRVARYW